MRRTRKWAYVAQEAQRLADLKLSAKEIAERLDVSKSTVTRWIAAGKLGKGSRPASAPEKDTLIAASKGQTPEQWVKSVRNAFDLDATDEQLVSLAESTLLVARDPATPAQLRLQAMGRFQALVKQLSLVARAADAKPVEDAPKRRFQPPTRTGTDPRGILAEVK
jgi:predicted transcriptional regulator